MRQIISLFAVLAMLTGCVTDGPPMTAADRAANAQAMESYLKVWQMGQPKVVGPTPQPLRQPTRCRTFKSFNGWITDCN